MGGILSSRQRDGVEEVDVVTNHAYKYPPRTGNYFGSHFIMGGERFDTPQPESYLFGENSDLNFLGFRPTPFPYSPPQPNEPTKTLKSLVNIRKESLRFVRASNEYNKITTDRPEGRDAELGTNTCFNVEFVFDCDVRCAITIYYFCSEEFGTSGVTYTAKDPSITSETFRFKRGANQHFCQPTHVFNPAKYTEEELLYDVDKELIPIAIHCVAEEGPDEFRQSHTTIATVEKISDGTYLLKALKQKLFVDGLCYLLQEIYGIENKNNDKMSGDEETEDNGSECVICMCDVRDTLILPCRHLCLCNSCADSLRYQANNCPICRAPFRALLQIRALQKSTNSNMIPPISADRGTDSEGGCENIPPGYEAVSLIEALNGPCSPRQPPSAMPDLIETPENEHAIQAAQILNRQCDRNSPSKNRIVENIAVDYTSSVLANIRGNPRTTDEENREASKCPLLSEQKEMVARGKHIRHRDSVKLVNEREKEDNIDDDSEAEKLSPLLTKRSSINASNLPLNIEDVIDPIDRDADTDHEGSQTQESPDKMKNYTERGDESDYYTPDEPAPILGPLYESGTTSSIDSTPQRMPGTPMSHTSIKSSNDSYTSGSSTRHLLAVVKNDSNDRSVHV